MAVEMKQEKITMTHLKKYLSLFEKAGLYWWCLLLIPCIEVLISAANALFYQKIIFNFLFFRLTFYQCGDGFGHAAVL